MKRNGFLGLLILAWVSQASADEIFQFYTGIRQQGMGGAAIAVVNDETALLLNPAALGKLRDKFFTIADPEIEANGQGIITSSADANSATDPQVLLNNLNKYPGKYYHTRGGIFPSLVLPNFGFGIFARQTQDAEVDSTGTNFLLNYRRDEGAAIGYNLRLWGGRVKIGFNARGFDRLEVAKTLPANSTNLDFKNIGAEGWGLASDGGIILTAPWRWLPTISCVVRDIGGTSFGLGEGLAYNTDLNSPDRPLDVRQTVNVGVALFPILANHLRMELTAEMDDVGTQDPLEQSNPVRRLHGGGEINISDFLFLRGGVNQGFWTAGLEFATTNFQIQFAAYGEDIGAPGTPVEDRRYMAKFAFRF